MHKLLTGIFKEHPGKTVYLSLDKFPRVEFDRGTMEVTNGSDAPLTPEKLAEIINSLITDEEGATLKLERFVAAQMTDEFYLRNISIQYDEKDIDVRITSRLLSDIEAEKKKIEDTANTLELVKG